MLKNYNLKITDFILEKKKGTPKNKQNFLNSILLYVHNFFENENKVRPKVNKFYLPLPRINIRLTQHGGLSSLQYDLYRRINLFKALTARNPYNNFIFIIF